MAQSGERQRCLDLRRACLGSRRHLLTEPMRRRVEEVFAPDLAAFDYSF